MAAKRSTGTFGRSGGPAKAKKRKDEVPDVRECLHYLRGLWPRAAFDDRLPPVIMKHQLYSLCPDRTAVDHQVAELTKSGTVCMFKLDATQDDYAVVDTADYLAMLAGSELPSLARLPTVLERCRDVSVTRADLAEGRCSEKDISNLVAAGVLVVRDVGQHASWWLSIPGAGAFTQQLSKGRSLVLQMLRRAKYRELMLSELKGRPLKGCKLGAEYIIHDVIGADLVDRIETSGGVLLRLAPSTAEPTR